MGIKYYRWKNGKFQGQIEIFKEVFNKNGEDFFRFVSGRTAKISDLGLTFTEISENEFHSGTQTEIVSEETVGQFGELIPPKIADTKAGLTGASSTQLNGGNAAVNVPRPDEKNAAAVLHALNEEKQQGVAAAPIPSSGAKIFEGIDDPGLEKAATVKINPLAGIDDTPVVEVKDPIETLIKTAKREKIKINLEMELDIPSADFLKILQSTYPENTKILKYFIEIIKEGNLDEELEKFAELYINKEKHNKNVEEPEIKEEHVIKSEPIFIKENKSKPTKKKTEPSK